MEWEVCRGILSGTGNVPVDTCGGYAFPPRCSCMNIEYLYPVWLVLCMASGAHIGTQTGQGVFQGMADGVIVAFLPVFLLMLVLWSMSLWRPILPPCRCGKCKHKEYRYVSPDESGHAGVRFGCPACGRIYEAGENRFDEVTCDGGIAPFMRHTKWGRWKQCAADAPRPGVPE